MARTSPPRADLIETEPNLRQQALAAWCEEQTGYEIDLKSVQISQALTNDFRGSDADIAWREDQKRLSREAKAAQRRAGVEKRFGSRAERLKAELAALEQQQAEAEAAIAEGRSYVTRSPNAPASPAQRVPAKKAPAKKAPAKRPAAKARDNVTELPRSAAKKAPAKKAARRSAVAPTVPSDDDF